MPMCKYGAVWKEKEREGVKCGKGMNTTLLCGVLLAGQALSFLMTRLYCKQKLSYFLLLPY